MPSNISRRAFVHGLPLSHKNHNDKPAVVGGVGSNEIRKDTNMKFIATFILLTILAGCTATKLPSAKITKMTTTEAVEIIERIFFEQPEKHRPQNAVVTENYIGLSNGTTTNTKGSVVGFPAGSTIIGIGNQMASTQELSSRIYFDRLGKSEIYKKRNWFIVVLQDKEGRVILRLYTRYKQLAEKSVSAISHFVATSQ